MIYLFNYLKLIIKMSRLYVGNVSSKASLQELKDLLGEVGKIKFFGISTESGYMVNKESFKRIAF